MSTDLQKYRGGIIIHRIKSTVQQYLNITDKILRMLPEAKSLNLKSRILHSELYSLGEYGQLNGLRIRVEGDYILLKYRKAFDESVFNICNRQEELYSID